MSQLLIELPVIQNKTGGIILYEGPSQLDGQPVVLIATLKTHNAKTGNLIQTWILRSDMTPLDAISTGDDSSICGDCKHRGENGKKRSCYVNVHQAPLNIYRTYKAGKYGRFDPKKPEQYNWISGRKLRCGSYGDPVAVPFEVWENLVPRSTGWTGYTHAWQTCDQRFKSILMASVDTEEEYQQAREKGWRTFRVKDANAELLKGEFLCPASEEAGKKRTCEECLACCGTKQGSLGPRAGTVTIVVHGSKAKISSWHKNKPICPTTLDKTAELQRLAK